MEITEDKTDRTEGPPYYGMGCGVGAVQSILKKFVDYFNGMDEISNPTSDYMNDMVDDFLEFKFREYYDRKVHGWRYDQGD